MTTQWCATERENGLTVLDALKKWVPEAPPAYLRQLLRKGKCLRNGVPCDATDAVLPEDTFELPESARLRHFVALAAKHEVDILCETATWLAAYKPPGLAVHRGVGHEEDNLLFRVQRIMTSRRAPFSVAPVHRLDAETSGPVLFAKGKKAAGILGKAFMEGTPHKTYIALVSGTLPEEGLLTTPVPAKGKIKDARTAYKLIDARSGYSLIELDLISGRTHQIRRQLADAGHPIAGDRRYGGKMPHCLERLFLHATSLVLPPLLDEPQTAVICPPPSELARLLEALGIDLPKGISAESTRSNAYRKSPS